ncbi:MAG: hypothetical protein WA985_05925 [Erythrobacter sp.]
MQLFQFQFQVMDRRIEMGGSDMRPDRIEPDQLPLQMLEYFFALGARVRLAFTIWHGLILSPTYCPETTGRCLMLP